MRESKLSCQFCIGSFREIYKIVLHMCLRTGLSVTMLLNVYANTPTLHKTFSLSIIADGSVVVIEVLDGQLSLT